MKKFVLWVVCVASLFGLQVDEADLVQAQSYAATMQQELEAFKRNLVTYDFTPLESSEESYKQLKIALLTSKRLYNSAVDDLARLAFKSLFSELKKPRTVVVRVTQSCGEDALHVCKAKAVETAKQKAIEENGAGILKSQILLENNALIEDKIFSQYSGVISFFEILEERIIEGGIGYAIHAKAVIEGNIPTSVIDALRPEKISWNFEQNYDAFPSVPFVVSRMQKEHSEDKVTNWLGLKQERKSGLFLLGRIAPQYHDTGVFEYNAIQTIGGIKAGYEFANWGLYTQVLMKLFEGNTFGIRPISVERYNFENIVAGVQIYINNFQVSGNVGIANQSYRIVGNDYTSRGLYIAGIIAYRLTQNSPFIVDVGVEVGNVFGLPGNFDNVTDTVLKSQLNNLTSKSIISMTLDVGYKF
ncbi:MAG: hypothetical protein KU37_05005 [Sulfuricurvum sp. PC08-66]|nr:MAG: hypothetical protein KU37_05005 [Sulfuricurvum sp. PC08-66]